MYRNSHITTSLIITRCIKNEEDQNRKKENIAELDKDLKKKIFRAHWLQNVVRNGKTAEYVHCLHSSHSFETLSDAEGKIYVMRKNGPSVTFS